MEALKLNEFSFMLRDCFESDSELINTWHIEAGNGLDACIKRTNDDLTNCNAVVYGLYNNSNLIGYFGIENHFLTGFFLKPSYRNKDNIKEFWSIVDKNFESDYYAGIYKKNKRAFDFLRKRSNTYFDLKELNAVCFVIDKEKSCQ